MVCSIIGNSFIRSDSWASCYVIPDYEKGQFTEERSETALKCCFPGKAYGFSIPFKCEKNALENKVSKRQEKTRDFVYWYCLHLLLIQKGQERKLLMSIVDWNKGLKDCADRRKVTKITEWSMHMRLLPWFLTASWCRFETVDLNVT